jgi:hypothetical protein
MSRRVKFFALLCLLSKLSTLVVAGEKSAGDNPCAGQITYQSDKDDAYKYLEDQQRQIYSENPQLTDPFSREELNKPRSVAKWADLKARALRACPDPSVPEHCAFDSKVLDQLMNETACPTLPTRFESPLFFSGIQGFMGLVDKIRLRHFPQSSIIRFGSLPTGTFDAQAILPPGSKVPLIILNRDIFAFVGAFSAAIADSIPIIITNKGVKLDSSEAGIRKRLRDHPNIVHNFADAMSRLVREGSAVGATRLTILDEDHNPLLRRLLLAMDLFLISHEEAHVILGHVSDQSVEFHLAGSRRKGTSAQPPGRDARNAQILSVPSKNQADGSFTTLKAELRTREQELQADALGFSLLMWDEEEEVRDPISEQVAAATPYLVFYVLDAASAYGSEAGGWTFSDANHPTAADRIKALSPVFDPLAETRKPPSEMDFRITFDAAFKVLLEEADPQIRQNLGLKTKDTK